MTVQVLHKGSSNFMGVDRVFGAAAHLAAFSDHAHIQIASLILIPTPSCAGNAEENETTQHYHTVAELSSTDLSDEPAKTDTDDNNTTTTVIQDT